MKIRYYIRPGLDPNTSSHMYYTASEPQPQQKLRLHRVKLSHLQSLYHHHPSSSPRSKSHSHSWFDSYLDWVDRLEDALARQREPQSPQTPCTAFPISPGPTTKPLEQRKEGREGPFTDSGEKSLWLVEGLLLAAWLSLQEGVEGVEYLPLSSLSPRAEDAGVYRLEQHEGVDVEDEGVAMGMGDVERKEMGRGNNAGVMMRRLLDVIRAGNEMTCDVAG